MLSRFYRGALPIGLAFGLGYVALNSSTPRTQTEDLAWELNASYMQAAGLPLPSHMPRVRDVMRYQVSLPTHQELEIEWDLIPGSDYPVRREEVSEGSLSSNFALLSRKQSVRGNARTSTLTLSDLTLVSVAVAADGEVRGLTVGPGSPLIPAEYRNGKGGYVMVESKVTFELFLPDDPKIEKLVFLVSHSDGAKYLLEKVGTLELNSRKPSA
jgi:hypothetical protein